MTAEKPETSSPPPAATPSIPARTRWTLLLVLGFGVALLLVLIAVPAPRTSFERTASLPTEPPDKPQILNEAPHGRAPVYPPAVAALPPAATTPQAASPAPSFEELAPTVPASGAPSPWRLPADLEPVAGRRQGADPEMARRRRLAAPLTASDAPPPPEPAPEDPYQPSTAPFLRSMLDATQSLTGLSAATAQGGLPGLPGATPAALVRPEASSASPAERRASPRLRPGQRSVPRGTVIPALLLYPVASPAAEGSTAVALVTEDVTDSTGSLVAIPKGSRLFGSPLAGATGSKRLLLVWHQLLLPDGRSLEIPSASTRDELLAEGLVASGRSPIWSALGKAALLGVLGSGAQLAAPEARANGYLPPATATAASVAAEITEVGRELVHQSLSLTPYFTVPGGTRLNLLLNDDLPL